MARTRDADGWRENAQKNTKMEASGQENQRRPRKRWIEDAEDDIQTMGIRGWTDQGKDGMEENRQEG